MSVKSLDQERAAYAWERVSGKADSYKEKYKNLSKSFPALIMSNGLMQSIAYLGEKDSDEHKALLSDIISWFVKKGLMSEDKAGQGFNGIMTVLSNSNSEKYRRATEEALEILKWIRQMADASIRGD